MHIQNTLPQFDNYTLDNYRLKKSVTYKKACILIFSGISSGQCKFKSKT